MEDIEKDIFIETLDTIGKNLVNVQKNINDARYCFEHKKYYSAYETAFEIENDLEKMVLDSRKAPILLGNETAYDRVDNVIKENIQVDIGMTPEGWFCVKMPVLLPKKEKGNVNYIRGFLYPAMRKYFSNHECFLSKDCFIVYKHIYDEKRPMRQWRDHDNIEVNIVTDIIALYTMCDDHPYYCSHLYCSCAGENDRTEVYVVPNPDINKWIEKHMHNKTIKE